MLIFIIILTFIILFKLKYLKFTLVSNGYIYDNYYIFPIDGRKLAIDKYNSLNKKNSYRDLDYICVHIMKDNKVIEYIQYFNKENKINIEGLKNNLLISNPILTDNINKYFKKTFFIYINTKINSFYVLEKIVKDEKFIKYLNILIKKVKENEYHSVSSKRIRNMSRREERRASGVYEPEKFIKRWKK